MAKILVVEDDTDLSVMIVDYLRLHKHTVDAVHDGEAAKSYITTSSFDLILLDWQLPGCSGLSICHDFRRAGGNTPILFLTGRDALVDKEAGLDSGADDYLTKPFHLGELGARVRALLRRVPVMQYKELRARDIVLDISTHRVMKKDSELKLYPKEFALLEFFLRHPNQIFDAEALMNKVWTTESESSVHTVRQCLLRLRQRIENDFERPYIETIRGVGYRFVP